MVRLACLIGCGVLILGQTRAFSHSLKGDGPTDIAAAGNAVWVGSGNGSVTRIDSMTGRTTARPLGNGDAYGFVGSMAIGSGEIWVADRREFLKRIDTRTNRVRVVRHLGHTADLVAIGRGLVWAGDFQREAVLRVDPTTNQVVGTFRVPGRLFGLAAGGAGAWVVIVPTTGPTTGPRGVRHLYRLDARSGLQGKPLRLGCDPALAVDRAVVWVVDQCRGRLLRVTPRGRIDRSVAVPRWTAPVLGFGSIWLVGGGRVLRLDRRALEPIATIAVRGMGAATSRDGLWVLDHGDGVVGFLRKIDPRTNRVVATVEIRP
jgi:DNA-binding beta-propeller fold protein YncE